MAEEGKYSLKEFIEEKFKTVNEKLDDFLSSHRDLEKIVQNNKERITQINTKINTTIWAFSLTIPIIIMLITYIYTKELEQTKEYIDNKVEKPLSSQIPK